MTQREARPTGPDAHALPALAALAVLVARRLAEIEPELERLRRLYRRQVMQGRMWGFVAFERSCALLIWELFL